MSDQDYTARRPGDVADLSGQTFAQLKVIEFAGFNSDNRPRWLCVCSCGNTKVIAAKRLMAGLTRSCGCLQRKVAAERHTTHGMSRDALYHIYNNMVRRCHKPKSSSYEYYGGRGITVCAEWLTGFAAFQGWALANGYESGLSIERRDVNGNYEPSNCIWISQAEQMHNTRCSTMLTVQGETKSLPQWLKDPRCKVGRAALRSRLADGWDAEKAILTPRIRPCRGIRYSRNPPPEASC